MKHNYPLHEKIRRLRLENNITQKQASDDLNISRACISNYERGLRVPDINTLKDMAAYYGVELSCLLSEGKSPAKTGLMLNESAPSKAVSPRSEKAGADGTINISKMSPSSKIALRCFYDFLSCSESSVKKKVPENHGSK